MNSALLLVFMFALTGSMVLLIDHHYYAKATVVCLEKKIYDEHYSSR